MFQKWRLAGLETSPIQPFVIDGLTRKQVTRPKQQRKGQNHWCIESTMSQVCSQHLVFEPRIEAALLIVGCPFSIETKFEMP